MKRFLLAALGALFFTSLAYTMCVTVTAEPVPSGRNAKITVLYDGKPQEHVKLTVTLLGEGSFRSFITDSHGTAMLKDLPAGTNCVTAVGENDLQGYLGYLCLGVSNSNAQMSSFMLTLADSLPPLPAPGNRPPDLLRQLEMVVEDASGGFVPHAEVQVYERKSYHKNPLVKAWTDQEGRLAVPLNPGTYAVTVRSPGFKATVRAIEISPEGRAGPVREVLQPGSC